MLAISLEMRCGLMATLSSLTAVAVEPQPLLNSSHSSLAPDVKLQANQWLRRIISRGLPVACALLSWTELAHFRSERP